MAAAQRVNGRTTSMTVLAGNPNSGKSTIFNNLTGSRQHVGNWPGVTVEKKEGFLEADGKLLRVVDLPGTYGLGAYSEDEEIARNCILFDRPDVVLNIVDATNLERNLYLTTQLMEMGARLVIALNMFDELKAKGMDINVGRLSDLFGVPVIPTVAVRNLGMKELAAAVVKAVADDRPVVFRIDYGKDVEGELSVLEEEIESISNLPLGVSSRWLAVKVLEGDEALVKAVFSKADSERLLEMRKKCMDRLEKSIGEDVESWIAHKRYDFIGNIVKRVFKREETAAGSEGLSVSDRVDRVVTNRYLGIPIFLLCMWGTFQFTFKVGEPLVGLVETFFTWFGEAAGVWLAGIGAPGIVTSLVVDGIIGGVGSVLVLFPPILSLFLVISLLEDSGYMARAAYIMDRFMHALGLHGKSFIPLLVGFGCNVPAIMATRTLESKRDRMITILINPLMSCSARLPIYVLFAGALFASQQGLVIFSLYMLGLALAMLMALLFKRLFFKGEIPPFVMELPPYRVPSVRTTAAHMWERGSSFVRKAGTIIVAASVLVWALSNLPAGVEYASQDSLIGRLGGWIAPIFRPAGFGTWQASVALVFGFLAKEVVVSTLALVYGVAEDGLGQVIAQHWTPLSAYAFMAMTLIYIPCVASIGAVKHETNSWAWTAFSVGYSLILGWLVAVAIFQAGRLIGLS